MQGLCLLVLKTEEGGKKKLTEVKMITAGEGSRNRNCEDHRNRKKEVSGLLLSPPVFAANFKLGLEKADLGRENQGGRT